jgi:hypothetical protein
MIKNSVIICYLSAFREHNLKSTLQSFSLGHKSSHHFIDITNDEIINEICIFRIHKSQAKSVFICEGKSVHCMLLNPGFPYINIETIL